MTGRGGLAGFTVLDLSLGIAGSWASRLLANYGADVIKVESPDLRRSLRTVGPFSGNEPDPEKSLLFHYVNSEKRGVTLDLESSEERRRLLELVERSDALVEDRGAGAMEALGLSYQELRDRQPRIVMTSISPFGATGPYTNYLAPNLVQHAIDGQLSLAGNSDRPPLRLGGNLGEYMPGVMAAVATAVGLYHAERSGEGDHIDLSAAGTTMFTTHQTASAAYNGSWLGNGRAQPERGFDRVQCADGFLGVHMLGTPGMLESLATLMEMPELLEDRPPREPALRREWNERVGQAIKQKLRDESRWEIFHQALSLRLPFGVFLEADDLVRLPPFLEREYFVELDHPVTGPELQPGAPVVMGDEACAFQASRAAPTLGQHNEEVFAGTRSEKEGRTSSASAHSAKSLGLPFAGLNVLDFTAGWAGPLAGQLLGFFGAEVIKVESIQRLDWWRASGTGTLEDLGHEKSALFNSVNRNKKEVTLDLKDPRGKKLFQELADRSDILVDNYSAHVLPSLGLSYEVLSATNPGLIMVSAPAFGTRGSWKDYPGFGTNVDEIAGHAALTGYDGGPPEQYNSANLTDPLVGLYASFAISVALRHRQNTGRGQFIDISHIEASATFLGEALMDYSINGKIWARMGNRHPFLAPHGLYRCSGEDNWVAIAVESDEQFQRLAAAIGIPTLSDDPRFAAVASRRKHQDGLDELIGRWTCEREKREVQQLLQKAGVPAGAVLTPPEVLNDPHFVQTNHFERVRRDYVGEHLYPAMPAKFSRHEMSTRLPAPTLGEHNVPVLHDLLGLPLDEIQELERGNVIGTRPLT